MTHTPAPTPVSAKDRSALLASLVVDTDRGESPFGWSAPQPAGTTEGTGR